MNIDWTLIPMHDRLNGRWERRELLEVTGPVNPAAETNRFLVDTTTGEWRTHGGTISLNTIAQNRTNP